MLLPRSTNPDGDPENKKAATTTRATTNPDGSRIVDQSNSRRNSPPPPQRSLANAEVVTAATRQGGRPGTSKSHASHEALTCVQDWGLTLSGAGEVSWAQGNNMWQPHPVPHGAKVRRVVESGNSAAVDGIISGRRESKNPMGGLYTVTMSHKGIRERNVRKAAKEAKSRASTAATSINSKIHAITEDQFPSRPGTGRTKDDSRVDGTLRTDL